MMAQQGREDAKRTRYVCPRCFTGHFSNDVLFAARRRSRGRSDMRQAVRQYALSDDMDFQRWCQAEGGWSLLNWRTMPEDRRRWADGVITAVRDMDGTWVTRRVCPCCHGPLPDKPFPAVFGWREGRIDMDTAAELIQCAAQAAPERWRMRREDASPLSYLFLDSPSGTVLGVPELPGEGRGRYMKSFTSRCCCSAAGAVIRLSVTPEEDGGLDDQQAQETLYSLLDICGCYGSELKLSAVILLEGLDGPDAAALFREKCANLARDMEFSFENSYITAAGEDPRAAVQAVEWLGNHVGGL